MSKLFERLIEKRGFSDDYINPRYDGLDDPFLLPGMEKVVERIKEAVERGEKILIYGDYDVDGVTASAVMSETLCLAGAKAENIFIMLPDRFADGYGMSPKLIKRANKIGAKLVITVDCGSRNHDIIDELNTLGIDCIVTDHHELGENLPEALAVINPKRKDVLNQNLKDLAGVGVAFMVALALVKNGLVKSGQEKWLLDLVLIGTICDSMTFSLDNHILGYFGLKVLSKTRRVGLKELMKKAGVKNLNSEAIGFQIGPRLNAAGRLETADLALNLIQSDLAPGAAALAEKLEELNKKRKIEQNSAISDIKEHGVGEDPVIVAVGKWHEGILGIIAGRLLEEYARPAFVLSEVGEGIYKGSGRSFGDFSLAKALEYAGGVIMAGGGHAAAAGVRIEQNNLYAFREKINEYYRSLNLKDQKKYLKVTPDLEVDDLSELNLDFIEELKRIEPFGMGNQEPIFCLKKVRLHDVRKMGADGKHLRLDVVDKNGKFMKLVAFFAPEKWLNLLPEEQEIEPIITINENEFNGVRSVEGRILDINML